MGDGTFLDRREIGKTGLATGRMGIGSTFNASADVIAAAFDRGVNYLYWGTVRQPDFAKAIRNLSKQHRHELVLTIQYTSTRWGHLLDPAKMPSGEAPVSACDCYRYALSHPAVDMVTAGPANAAQMDEALQALERGPLDADERARVERIGAHLYAQYAPQYPDRGDVEDVAAGRAAGKG